jgi:hypothetical protein
MPAMVRRAFVTLLSSATIWPIAALAQKLDGVRRDRPRRTLIGFYEPQSYRNGHPAAHNGPVVGSSPASAWRHTQRG